MSVNVWDNDSQSVFALPMERAIPEFPDTQAYVLQWDIALQLLAYRPNTAVDPAQGTYVPGLPYTAGSVGAWLNSLGQGGDTTGAALIPFKQLGSSYIRSLQEKDQEILSFGDYGAVGDGISDNLLPFQAVAAAHLLSPNGLSIYLPRGEFLLSAGVTFSNAKSLRIYGEGDASVIRLMTGAGGAVLTIGTASVYPTRQEVSNISIKAPGVGTSNGIRFINCNTLKANNCFLQLQVTGFLFDSCYAPEILANTFDVCTAYAMYSSTSMHNSIIERNNFFTCGVAGGGQVINIAVASDNVVIDNNDFEYCNVVLRMAGGSSLSFRGNYVEYTASSIFDFTAPVYQSVIELNWLAFGVLSTTIANCIGGKFRHNRVHNQTVGVAASCVNFNVGDNFKTGTGTLAGSSWSTAVLSGTYAQQAGYYTAQYFKQDNGQVMLRGNLLNGAAVPSLVFNLPVGFRPAAAMVFATASSAQPGLSIIEVRANGDVFCLLKDTGTGTGLNGISFEALN